MLCLAFACKTLVTRFCVANAILALFESICCLTCGMVLFNLLCTYISTFFFCLLLLLKFLNISPPILYTPSTRTVVSCPTCHSSPYSQNTTSQAPTPATMPKPQMAHGPLQTARNHSRPPPTHRFPVHMVGGLGQVTLQHSQAQTGVPCSTCVCVCVIGVHCFCMPECVCMCVFHACMSLCISVCAFQYVQTCT